MKWSHFLLLLNWNRNVASSKDEAFFLSKKLVEVKNVLFFAFAFPASEASGISAAMCVKREPHRG